MATTTNYGWTTPDDTALVKDGASAIRTLGSSVDTTTKNLNPSTTLGDIEYRSSTANVNTRLGLGTAGQFLAVNSGATAPEWQTLNAGGMTLLSTTTLSGATTTISSINQTYKDLLIIVSGMTANTGNDDFRLMPNNVTNLIDCTGTETGAATGNPDSRLVLTIFATSLRTSASNVWAVKFYNYASSTTFKPFEVSGFWTGPTSNKQVQLGGAFRSNTAISSLVFDYGGTKTFAGGTVLLYGVK
jgi:hypothetical protein